MTWTEPTRSASFQLYLGNPADRAQADPAEMTPVQDRLRYGGLFWPLRLLCLGFDWFLRTLRDLVANWGAAIVLLSVLMRVLLFPVNRLVTKYQDQVNAILSILEPRFDAIKQEFDGQQAHERMMAEYKKLGITPFYTLKPMIGVFIQVPVLIAIFNVLGELEAVRGVGFLWIRDLSYPDSVATLPFAVPLLGSGINLLPMLMTLFSIAAGWTQHFGNMTPELVARQRRNLSLMAAGFLLLFYPFPASMVLYWTTANILQLVEQALRRSK